VNESIVSDVYLNVAARMEMIHSIMLSCEDAKKVIGWSFGELSWKRGCLLSSGVTCVSWRSLMRRSTFAVDSFRFTRRSQPTISQKHDDQIPKKAPFRFSTPLKEAVSLIRARVETFVRGDEWLNAEDRATSR
jgi:hypothetical protein